MISALSQRWESMTQRERAMFLTAAAVVIATLFFLLVWEPLHKANRSLEVRRAESRELISWLRAAGAEAQVLRGSAQPSGPVDRSKSLLIIIDQSSQAAVKEHIKRIQPEGDSEVRVFVESAPFNDLLSWLDALRRKHGVIVTSVSMDAGDRPGRVNARLNLSRPAS